MKPDLDGIHLVVLLASTHKPMAGCQPVQQRTGNHAKFAWKSPAVVGRQRAHWLCLPADADQVCRGFQRPLDGRLLIRISKHPTLSLPCSRISAIPTLLKRRDGADSRCLNRGVPEDLARCRRSAVQRHLRHLPLPLPLLHLKLSHHTTRRLFHRILHCLRFTISMVQLSVNINRLLRPTSTTKLLQCGEVERDGVVKPSNHGIIVFPAKALSNPSDAVMD